MMRQSKGSLARKYVIGLTIICICLLTAATSQAVSLIWDPAISGGVTPGGAGNWDITTPLANWYDASIPADVAWTAGSDAVFGTIGGAVAVDAAGVNVHNMDFNVSGYSLSGGAITLSGTTPTITVANGGESATIISDIIATGDLAVGGSGDLILNRVYRTATPTATLTKSGTGTLTLGGTGDNNWLANVVNGGTLVLAKTDANKATDNLTVNTGGTVKLGYANVDFVSLAHQISNSATVTLAGGTLDLNGLSETIGVLSDGSVTTGTVTNGVALSTSTLTFNSGTGIYAGLIQNGAGTVAVAQTGGNQTLSGTNTYTGGTTVSGGTLNINTAGAISTGALTLSGGTINNTSGAALTLTNNNAINWNGNFTFAGANNLNLGAGAVTLNGAVNPTVTVSAGTLTVGGIIGNGTWTGFTKAGTGTLLLNNANTYNGTTTLSGGTLGIVNASALSTSVVNFNGGTIDNLTGLPQTLTNIVTWSGNVGFGGTNNLTFSDTTAISTDLNKTITLGGSGSTLTFAASINNNNSGDKTLTVNGAGNTLVLGNALALTLRNTGDTSNRTVTIGGTGNTIVTGAIANGGGTGTGALRINTKDTGTVTLKAGVVNTYTGTTDLRAGTLVLDYTAGNVSKLPASLTASGPATLSLANAASAFAQVVTSTTLNNASALNVVQSSGLATLRMNNITRNAGSALNIGAAGIADTDANGANGILGGYATVGRADWAVSANSGAADTPITAYAGYVPIAGALTTDNVLITDSATLSAAPTINTLKINTTLASQSLDLGGFAAQLNVGGLLITGSNSYEIKNGTLKGGQATTSELIIHQNNSGLATISAVIANGIGNSNLTKAGTGTLLLSGANTYSGTTYVAEGTLQLGNASALGTTTAGLTVGGTLDLNGTSVGVGAFNTGYGTITNTAGGPAATITVGNGNARITGISGSTLFTGNVNLKIVGNNATKDDFGGVNTHTGGITFQGNNLNDRLGNGLTLGSGPVTFNGNGGFQVVSSGISNWNNVPNDFVVNNTGNVWYSDNGGAIGTAGAWSGTGTLRLNANRGGGQFNLAGNVTGFQGKLELYTPATTTYFNLSNSTTIGAPLTTFNMLSSGTGSPTLRWNGTGSQTIPLGDLNTTGNLGTGTISLLNNVNNTTATFQVGNLNQNSTFTGNITDNSAGGTGITAIQKVGTGIWTLTGSHSYTGATTIDGGTLNISGNAVLGATAVTVNSGAKLNMGGFTSISFSGSILVNGGGIFDGTTSISAPVTVVGGVDSASRGSINLVDSIYGTLSLNGGFNLGDANPASLSFEVGSSGINDLLYNSGTFTLGAGGALISIADNGMANGASYTLMSYSLGSAPTNILFDNGSLTKQFGFNAATLSATTLGVTMNVTGNPEPATAYWTGALGATWDAISGSNANFTLTPGGANTQQFPGSTTDVYFITSGSNFTNSLGASNRAVRGLYFQGTPAVDVSGAGRQLSIGFNGINLSPGSGGATLAMSSIGLSSWQTWTNNSSNLLTVSAAINDGGSNYSLTFDGTGTTVLSGANTYSGGTIINAGSTVQLSGAGTLGAASSLVNLYGALDLGGTSQIVGSLNGTGSMVNNGGTASTFTVADGTYSGTISNGAGSIALVKSTAGTLTLSGANSYSGGTTVNAGTVQIGSGTALGTGSATFASASTLDLNGQTIANALTVNGAGISGLAVILNDSPTPAAITANVIAAGNISIGGAGNITLGQGISATGNRTITKTGTGTLTLAGTATQGIPSGADIRNGLVINDGTAVLAKDGTLACDNVTVGTVTTSATLAFDPAHVNTAGPTWGGQVNGSITITNGTWDLKGATVDGNGKIQQLIGTTSAIVTNTSSSPATISIQARNNNTYTFAGVIQDGGVGTGRVSWYQTSNQGLGPNRINELTGVNTYTGTTTINGGILKLSGSGSIGNSSEIIINSAGRFDVSATSANSTGPGPAGSGGQIISGSGTILGNFTHGQGFLTPGTSTTAGTLTFNNDLVTAYVDDFSGGTINFNVSPSTTTGNDLINVGGISTATVGGTVVVNVGVLGAATTGTYTMLSAPTGLTGSIAGWSVGSWDGRGAAPTLTQTATTVDLNVTFSNASLKWRGNSSAAWDVNTTANWHNTAAEKFYTNDTVAFSDTYDGSNAPATTAVTLNTLVAPASVVCDASTLNYSISGTGRITGATSLVKSGASTLTVSTDNLYTGGTVINGGILSVSNVLGDNTLGDDAGMVTINKTGVPQAVLKVTTGFGFAITRPLTIGAGGGAIEVDPAQELAISPNAAASTSSAFNGPLAVQGGGTLTLNVSGAPTVGAGASLSIAGSTTMNVGGSADPFTSGAIHMAVANDGIFNVTTGPKQVGAISGIGATDLSGGVSLTAASVTQGTLTIGAGATLTIVAIPGGPLSGAGGLTAVPEPSTWAMLLLAAMGLGIYCRRGR